MMSYRVIILCAGVGERLRPLTYVLPKPLLEVNGKPLLSHFLDGLIYSGANIKSVHIVVGHLGKSFKKLIGSKYRGLKVRYINNPFYKLQDCAAHSLYAAGSILQKNATVIAHGDHYLHPELFKKLMKSPYNNCILMNADLSNQSHLDPEELGYGYEELVSRIGSPPSPPDDPVGKVLYIFKLSKASSNSLFTILEQVLLEKRKDELFLNTALNTLMKTHDMHYQLTEGLEEIEIDFLDEYERAKKLVFS